MSSRAPNGRNGAQQVLDPEDALRSSSQVHITLVSGSIAAVAATVTKQPIARIKFLKQVAESSTTVEQMSLYRLYADIIKREGVFLGLFRGSASACFRNIPHSVLTYTLYPCAQRLLHRSNMDARLIKSLSGSLASMSAHCLTHPLDTVRVRIATQYQTIEYPSIFHTFRSIWTHEGLNGFYRGLSMTLFGAVFRAGIGFGIYENLKSDEIRQWKSTHYPLMTRLGIGWMAGAFSTFCAYPIDTLRRRQQVFGRQRTIVDTHIIGGNIRQHLRALSATRFIYRNEGIRGFYKGIVLALIKSPLAASISLTTNDFVKSKLGWQA
eukprot:CAMPEP_0202695262 /NCGR_PEP_ID=MMETSP1385-20130828/8902_1 /ASSEMBLY_ACC=CAM_ASM_000861 /TAXON_ID=933848 /ORGANISM="Elphidium margaritaceum" /LENGTH=322 /DNA_ID=CAMNT_0049351261 /DNA_START=23 /DNA_END=991 /DNA_ORIENTATION=-